MDSQNKKSELTLIKEHLLYWLKNWKYFVATLFICGIFGILYLKLKAPEYQIEAKAMLREDALGGGGLSESSIMSSLGFGKKSGTNIEDETNIMGSNGSLQKLVYNLNLNNQYTLSEYFGMWKTDLYNQTPVKISYPESLPDTLLPVLLFKLSVNENSAKIKVKANKANLGTYEINSFPGTIQTPYGPFTFSKTSTLNTFDQSFKLNILVGSNNYWAQIFQQIVTVDYNKKTSDIILMSMQDENMLRAKSILNEIINVYNKESSQEKEFEGSKTIEFIDKRLEEVSQELIAADIAIERFKKNNKLTSIEADATAFLEQNTELQPKLLEAEIQLRIIDIIDDFIKDASNDNNPIPFSLSVTDQTMSEAIVGYNELLLKRNSMLESSNPKNMMVIEYSNQLNAMRKNLKMSLLNVKKGLQIGVNSLQQKQTEFDNRIGSLPSIEKQYLELKRTQEIQQTVYIFLREKREQTAVSSLSVMPKLRIIDAPHVLIKPVAPDKVKTIITVFFLGGIFFPILIIYFKPHLKFRKKKKEE